MKCFYEAKLALIAGLLERIAADVAVDTEGYRQGGSKVGVAVASAAHISFLNSIASVRALTAMHRGLVHEGDDPAEQAAFDMGLIDLVEKTVVRYLTAAKEQFPPPGNLN